ncbi:hypothetical protein SELMODRAFT_412609 [Selaginella moellendorffii]|uniref:RING-type domain-containing protein n=1 Tax=Selaginella moellendorffii TaxID=88036 RepID=D8RM20_SELML|nr:RING-H2 finger protein ATL72 [Selaginella moellendorffii]XP_002993551.1 RING-H2 finger protein ATL72 [Selaginella moellendorffii]EFJ05380.1 hypothetical protein SELMODRAFT_449161 [Selaginella moellendorffii]EFJ26816.1 hypothetical protein SELMODRAFT_412609 [Selaginella moellendorffii]|eukprot:XP_002971899.1 RING-H2 finger protein ATL72 [Selaginella moellendorffii]
MADWSSGGSISSFAWPPFPSNGMEDGQWPPWPGAGTGNNNFFGWQGFGFASPRRNDGLGAGTIILVAVLVTGFSLMTLLLLRLWFCGCSQDDDARRAGNSQPAIANKLAIGLRRDVIESFQVVNYKALVAMRGRESSSSAPGEGECCCPVCLIDFGEEDKRIRVLPGCGHGFHTECIDMWLFSHTSCPVCRRELLPPSPSSSARRDDRVVVIEIPQIHPQERG